MFIDLYNLVCYNNRQQISQRHIIKMKNKKAIKIFSIILCLCLTAALFSGCGSKNKAIDFIYPFSADVKSYDPQVASTSDEFLIIENTFEGLIRMDDNGKITSGMADSWNVSDDGLTYTFTLKKGMKWNIDTETDDKGEFKDSRLKMLGRVFDPEITANDFVFALRRAAQPETECPLFSSIACIKNAVSVHNGKMSSDKLGVKAVNNYQLEITLASADDSFMQTLTRAVAMPCNEEFFNATKGRYGLSTEYTLFNGQFYLSQILESSYLLKRNDKYTGPSAAKATELTLKITSGEDSAKLADNISSGYYDAAFISGSESDKIKQSSGVTYTSYNDTVWGFAFNTSTLLFQNDKMRKAFCLGLTRLDNTGKQYLTDATNIIPSSCTIGGKKAVDLIGNNVPKQDSAKSVELWKEGLKSISNTDFTVDILTTKTMQNYVKRMLQGVQSGIGNITENSDKEKITLTFKITAVDDSELDSKFADGDYDIAFRSYKATSSTAGAFLKTFEKSSVTALDSEKLKSYISKAESATSTKDAASYTKSAQYEIVGKYYIYPMLYETSYYAAAKGVSGIQFHAGTGRVSFVNATRE